MLRHLQSENILLPRPLKEGLHLQDEDHNHPDEDHLLHATEDLHLDEDEVPCAEEVQETDLEPMKIDLTALHCLLEIFQIIFVKEKSVNSLKNLEKWAKFLLA